MAQLKTIPFTAEVPVKEDGSYDLNANMSVGAIHSSGNISTTGQITATGGIQNSGSLLTKGNATFKGDVDAEGQTVKTGTIEVRGTGVQSVTGHVPFSAVTKNVGAPSTWAGPITTSYYSGTFSAIVSIYNGTDCCFIENSSGGSSLNFSGWPQLASDDQPTPQEYRLYGDSSDESSREYTVKCLTLKGEPVEGVPVGYWENHTAGAEGCGQIFGYIDGGINLDTRFLMWRGRRIYIDSNNFLKIV